MTACNDLSFHLDPGSVTVLLGPNGAGKSTIMKSIIGFLRYDGQIRANVTREALERDGRTLEQLFFFWSCFLDVLPAVVVGTLIGGRNLLTALAWIPLIVSVNFFVTTVGAFIGLSVPVSAGKIVKQLVQILFIYFGLLPDIAIMAVGLIFHHGVIAAVACAVFNVPLGLLFFGLTPLFLVPDNG